MASIFDYFRSLASPAPPPSVSGGDPMLAQLREALIDPTGRDSPRPRQRNYDLKELFEALGERDRQAQNRLAFRTGTHDAPMPEMAPPAATVAMPPMAAPAAAAPMPSPAALEEAAAPASAPAFSVGGGVPMVTGINPGATAPALRGLPPNLLSASAGDPMEMVRQAVSGGAPATPPAVPGAQQPELRSYEDRLKAAQAMLPKPPEMPKKTSGWDNVIRFGLGMMQAGERPGATVAGSIGRSGLATMDEMQREEERRTQIADRLYTHQVAAAQIANNMARGEGNEVLAQRDDIRKDRALAQNMQLHYDQLRQQASESGLNRGNQIAIARLNREAARLDREAARGTQEAISVLNAQSGRDAKLTETIEREIDKGKTGPGGIGESYTTEEASAKRRQIILNAPGTTLNEQLRTGELMSRMSQAKIAADGLRQQGRTSEADALLSRANDLFDREMKLIENDRLKLRK